MLTGGLLVLLIVLIMFGLLCAILRSRVSYNLFSSAQFLADRTEQYGRAYGTMFCPSVCRLSVTFVLWLKGMSQRVGDGTVGQGVGKFLQAVNSNNVAIWSGLAAVCKAKFPPALCSPVETVCYLFTLLIPEVVRSRLPGNFDWPKSVLNQQISPDLLYQIRSGFRR